MCLVAAFRKSILWGVSCLVIPFAQIVFCILHWTQAKKGFVISAIGLVSLIACVVAQPAARELFSKGTNLRPPESSGETKDMNSAIQNERDHELALKDELAKITATVAAQYKVLMEKRKTLESGNAVAVHAFNQEAAVYQQQNERVNSLKREIDATGAKISDLLSERAKQSAGGANGKQIVMYTTSSCPACKMAKQYMAEKGIPYREINVEQSREGYEEFRRLGGQGVPLIIVGDRRMEGFNPQALQAML